MGLRPPCAYHQKTRDLLLHDRQTADQLLGPTCDQWHSFAVSGGSRTRPARETENVAVGTPDLATAAQEQLRTAGEELAHLKAEAAFALEPLMVVEQDDEAIAQLPSVLMTLGGVVSDRARIERLVYVERGGRDIPVICTS